jgi:hypothetical protein
MKTFTKANSISLIIITSIIILFACKKSIQSGPGDGNGTGTGNGAGSVQGVITDLNNSPVSNATVTGGTATSTTDASGKFTLTKVQFSSNAVVVTVTKTGFFEGAKKFTATNNAVSNAVIQLIAKTVSGTIAAASGGNVNIQGGGSINFSPGFVTASNGSLYTGNVSVSARYLNPTDANFASYMPGDINVVSVNNQPGTLQSVGVVAVELNDGAGNKLQLANGKTATITIPIPSALTGISSSLMPLWYFDVTDGVWKQEGVATRHGDDYVGYVHHFTPWNSGFSVDTSQYIKLTIKDVSYTWSLPKYMFWGYNRTNDTSGSIRQTEIYSDTLGKNPAYEIVMGIRHNNISTGNVPPGKYPFWFTAKMKGLSYDNYLNPFDSTNVTEYGPVGGYITGSTSGFLFITRNDTTNTTTYSGPYTCEYKILRIQ